jgi:hypothetical protein
MNITDEQLKGCIQIATKMKPDTEGLLKQKQCQIHISLMTEFVKENY